MKIVNACIDLGTHVDGASLGPKALTDDVNNTDIVNIEQMNIVKSHDKNDLRKNESAVNEFCERLYKEIINTDDFVITIGGDHSLAVGSALASLRKHKDIGIVWIDAHPDYNTFETTITGNIHGLPLATITGINGNDLCKFHNDTFINKDNTVIIGARAIDPLEEKNLKDNNIKVYTSNEVLNNDVYKIMEEAFNKATDNGKKKTHVSFDVDVMDPILMPGVSIPEKNGITKKEVDIIYDFLLKNLDKIASFDIVEYNPLFDKNDITKNYVKEKLKELIRVLN